MSHPSGPRWRADQSADSVSVTGNLIFDVPALIAYISTVVTLEPGDLIFTGTPEGVGTIQNQCVRWKTTRRMAWP